MSETKGKKPAAPQAPTGDVGGSHQCRAEDCKKAPSRAGFCEEHYVWFKEGLITAKGTRAKDFDKKYQQYLARHKKAA